jgi:hypothetical protein
MIFGQQKCIPVTGRVRRPGSRIFYTNGSQMALSMSVTYLHTCRLRFTPTKILCTHFLLEAESTPGVIVRLQGLAKLKKISNDLIGTQTGDPLASNIVATDSSVR